MQTPSDLAQELAKIEIGSPLSEALPMAMGNDLPLVIMDDDKIAGFVTQEQLGKALTPEKGDNSDPKD